MIEQVKMFSCSTHKDGWNEKIEDGMNKFLAEKREDGAQKEITRVYHVESSGSYWLLVTIFYQWVEGPPNLGPFRTAPGT